MIMSFSITILGCSSAIPDPQRNSSAQVVDFDEKAYLIDCGEGTQIQMKKFHIRFQKIKQVFISHLHGDHFFGLIGLISTYSLIGRKDELHIYGPSPLKEIIDLQVMLTRMEIPFPLIFHPVDPLQHRMIFEDDHLKVYSLPMVHRIPTCGFLFVEKSRPLNIRKDFLESENLSFEEIRRIKMGSDYINPEGKVYLNQQITHSPIQPRTYAYCTDTAYNESLVPLIRKVTLLYHEATFMQGKIPQAEEWFHSTAAQAARIALLAEAGKLIIGHFSPRYKDLGPLLEEAKSVFPLSELAEDGKIFVIRP